MLRSSGSLLFVALLSISPFCWATDHILFSRLAPSEARLFISNADGSGERALTQSGTLDYNPAWSPSGDWIVFTSERAGSADLYRIHPDGAGLERLTDDPAYDDQGSLSPDGKQVVFVSTRAAGRANLWLLDVATRKAKPLTSGEGGDFRPAWSPDGKWIAFSSDRGSNLPRAKGRWELLQLVDIYLMRPDGTGLERISAHGNFCGGPKWTRDSKSVTAYCMSAEETWTYRWGDQDGETRLVQIDIQTGAMKPLAAAPGVKMSPSVLASDEIGYLRRDKSAKGVFYASGKHGPTGSDLYGPSWSPDGTRLVYGRYNDAFPSFAPDDVRIVYRTTGPDGEGLRIMNLEDHSITVLTKDYDNFPVWSSRGDLIAFVRKIGDDFEIFTIRPDGKDVTQLTHTKGNDAHFGWSPDGEHIVFTSSRMGFKDEALNTDAGAQPYGEIFVMRYDGTQVEQLTDNQWEDGGPAWQPRKANAHAAVRFK